MKRLKLTTLLLLLSSTTIFSQNYQYENRGGERSESHDDRRELRSFERILDQFSYALVTNNIRAARYAKYEILLDMEREIAQTRKSLSSISGWGEIQYSKREPDWRIPRMRSRQTGIQNESVFYSGSYAEIVHRLEKQERLYYRFSELPLERTRREIINENEHRRLMYSFQETMREELIANEFRRERGQRGR